MSEGYLHLSQDTAALSHLPAEPGEGHAAPARREEPRHPSGAGPALPALLPAADRRAAGLGEGERPRRSRPSPPRASRRSSARSRRSSTSSPAAISEYEADPSSGAGAGVDDPTRARRGSQADRLKHGELHRPRASACCTAQLESRIRERVEAADVRARQQRRGHHRPSRCWPSPSGLAVMAIAARTLRAGAHPDRGRLAHRARRLHARRSACSGEDEISVLAREFDAMARALARARGAAGGEAGGAAARRAAGRGGAHLRADRPRGPQPALLHRPQRGDARGSAGPRAASRTAARREEAGTCWPR